MRDGGKAGGKRLVVRLSDAELAEVEQAAGGLGAGARARGILLAAARRRAPPGRPGDRPRSRARLDARGVEVERLVAEGRRLPDIARELGCSRQAIYSLVRSWGLSRPRRSRLDGREAEIRGLLARASRGPRWAAAWR